MTKNKTLDAQLATLLVKPLINSCVSPNMLTTIRLLVGMAAFLAFASGLEHTLLGAWLFCLSSFLDHTDGELARVTGKQSHFGHLYDLASDAAVNILLFIGIGFGLMSGDMGSKALVMGIIAGIAVAGIFHLRYLIDKQNGKIATEQPSIGWFEAEDILYIMPLIVIFDVLEGFLITAAIGAPIAAIIVSIQFIYLSKQWKSET